MTVSALSYSLAPNPPFCDSAIYSSPFPLGPQRTGRGEKTFAPSCLLIFLLMSSHNGPVPSQQHWLQSLASLDINRSATSSRQQPLTSLTPSSWGSSFNSLGSDTLNIFCCHPKEWQRFPAVVTSVASVSPACLFSPLTLVKTMPNVKWTLWNT